jgi:hypothetical protein
MRLKGALWELGYRLRPARRAFGAGAKVVVTGAFVPIAIFVTGLSRLADLLGRLVAGVASIGRGMEARFESLMVAVRPERTVALVLLLAAIALTASQFADYRGVGIGEPDYSGEVGSVAPAPNTDRATAGSAHAYILIPVALAAVTFTIIALMGRWRLGRGVALLGFVGIAVSLVIDAPKGLDAGISGIAYYGADAQLLEGFWAQLASSATIAVLGLVLSAYARDASRASRTRYYAPASRRAGSPPGSPATPGEAGA